MSARAHPYAGDGNHTGSSNSADFTIGQRSITVPVDPAQLAQASGPVTVQYVEPTDTGLVTLAETSAVLR